MNILSIINADKQFLGLKNKLFSLFLSKNKISKHEKQDIHSFAFAVGHCFDRFSPTCKPRKMDIFRKSRK